MSVYVYRVLMVSAGLAVLYAATRLLKEAWKTWKCYVAPAQYPPQEPGPVYKDCHCPDVVEE